MDSLYLMISQMVHDITNGSLSGSSGMDNVLNSPSLHNSTSTGDYKLCSYSLLGSNFNFIHLKFEAENTMHWA